jgi:phytoene synthase
MLRRHDPTYAIAVARLPAQARPAVYALYGFVRGADEIVDGDRAPQDTADRLAALDAWENELFAGIAAGASDHPVIAALVDAGDRYDLPLGELHAYMRSMRVDCSLPVRIATRDELDRYAEGIAGAVGRIMAVILGAGAERKAFARLGLGFQLTNFLRDVREDYALDRIYLPADERARFGVEEAELAGPSATPALRSLIRDEVERARSLFAAGAPAIAAAPPGARRSMRLAQGAYSAVLDRIEAAGYDVLGRSTRPRPWQLARAAARALGTRA